MRRARDRRAVVGSAAARGDVAAVDRDRQHELAGREPALEAEIAGGDVLDLEAPDPEQPGEERRRPLVRAAVHPHRHAHAGHRAGIGEVGRGVERPGIQIPGAELEVRGDDVHPIDAVPAHVHRDAFSDRRIGSRVDLAFGDGAGEVHRRGVRPGLLDHRRSSSERRGIIRILALRAGRPDHPHIDRERSEQEQRGHCERGDHHHRAAFPPPISRSRVLHVLLLLRLVGVDMDHRRRLGPRSGLLRFGPDPWPELSPL